MSNTDCPAIRRSGITVLWGHDHSVVDIVLLHGLNGSPSSTWKHPSTGFYWPWELRQHIPDSRIMVFGYDADIAPQLGTNLIRIRGLAEGFLSSLVNKRQEDKEINRPLILIAHSLGGLIIKKALVLGAQAVNTEADDAHLIYQSTKGLVFLGTPHAGSAVDKRKRIWMLKLIAKVAFTVVPPKLESALEIHSDELSDLADDFRKITLWTERKLTIYTYYETHTTAAAGERVVDETSARIGYDKETTQPIQADHENMVKYRDDDDADYENVWGKIKILKRKAVPVNNESAQLDDAKTNKHEIKSSDVIIAVMGVTGAGKSTFIQHFTRQTIKSTMEGSSDVKAYRCSAEKIPEFYMIEFPGFDNCRYSDFEIFEKVTFFLSKTYSFDIKLSGIIYLHRISDARFGPSSRANLQVFKKLCGQDNFSSVVLVTTFWDHVDTATGLMREKEFMRNPQFWADMVAQGSSSYRQNEGMISGQRIIDYLIARRQMVVLQIQREMMVQNKTLGQTAAGREIQAQLMVEERKYKQSLADERKYKQSLADDREERAEALLERDRIWQEESEGHIEQIMSRIRQNAEDRAKLQANEE